MAPPSISSRNGAASAFKASTGKSESSPEKPATWKLYPMSSYDELLGKFQKENVKVIHIVRHAQGTHNVLDNYDDAANHDARLTPKGIQQCQELAQHVKESMPELVGNSAEIGVITSPLTRCVQTTLLSFPWLAEAEATTSDVPILAHESFRETVNYICDRRRPISRIAQEFPRVDFSLCDQDHDFIWDEYRSRLSDDWDQHMESAELNAVADRAVEAFRLLQERPQHHLIVCSHSAFLRCIFNWGHEGGVPRIMPQILDRRKEQVDHKLFEYFGDEAWEQKMRSDYENCELRSFCMLVNQEVDSLPDRSRGNHLRETGS
eukprot:scaffold388_cov114-Cylindrotheca_fusiformis.AAC.24